MEKLNKDLMAEVKRSFVAMPGGDPSQGAGPVAGGGMLTQAQASPMGGTPQMDPSMMGGAPMDPSMMGGAPMDPSMMGGAPMDPSMAGAPVDPSMMGGAAPAPAPADPSAGAMPPDMASAMINSAGPSGSITMTVQDLIAIIQAVQVPAGKSKSKPAAEGVAPAAGGDGTSAKLDQILQMLNGGGQPQKGQ